MIDKIKKLINSTNRRQEIKQLNGYKLTIPFWEMNRRDEGNDDT